MKTRNSSMEEFLKSQAKHLIFVEESDSYSPLERLVQADMKRVGLNYPHVSVDDVKAYWNVRLS